MATTPARSRRRKAAVQNTHPESEAAVAGAAPATEGGTAAAPAAEAVAAVPDEAEATVVTHLCVRALREGFRRCGRAWSVHAIEVDVAAFTAAEVARLIADPDLSVVVVCQPRRPTE